MGGGWGGLLSLILGSTEYMWTPGGAAGQSPRPPTAQAAGAQLCLPVEPLLCALSCTDQILSQAATPPPPQPPLLFLTGHSTRGIRRL